MVVNVGELNLFLVAAGVAFYSMLALFPAMGAVISVWGFISDPLIVEEQIQLLRGFVPADAYSIIETQVAQLVDTNESALGWTTIISLAAALWSARLGVASLIQGLNAIYREKDRNGVLHLVTAFIVTFILIGVALVALASVVVMPVILAFLPLGPLAALAVSAVRWITTVAVMMLALGVIYRFGPNRKAARSAWLSPGAGLAVLIWGASSYAFSYYLSNFGNYNEVYGALGAVIALLMWLYISAFVVLLGALLNAELELRTRQDSTIGPSNPPGFRGAYVADHYTAAD
ncbi:YihY/virulence factor BrkB family protein [Mesobaculum littorinae]|uniref:YihY/virulence factor BrkB family protein n=2 Tax=Mesobaculum littorinae TaxID=2486419 RepID=A0A438AHW9_9RHOB|nr:YihY/virulence factor BrkB family protein [Mesobaculum littorinae]